MKISVAIPTRNGARYLAEALRSIRSQTRLPDEVVISDDDSSDGTYDLCLDIARSAPFKVDLHRHIPAGITANYLHALEQTTGDIVVFSDQDDVWLPEKLAKIENVFVTQPDASIVSSDSAIVDEHLRPTGTTLRNGIERSRAVAASVNAGNDIQGLIRGLPLLAHTLAVRGSCRPTLLAKPEKPDEWWFESWVSMMAISQGRLVLIPEALTLYRQHPAQSAGAPVRSLRPLGSLQSYRNAADRFRFIVSRMNAHAGCFIADENVIARRRSIVEDYVELLEFRCHLLERPQFARPLRLFAPATLRRYWQYSSGIKSIAYDVIRPRGTHGQE